MAHKKLTRSIDDRKIFGVCGGLGDYFGIDPIIFRILFLFLLFCAGGGLLLYLIMWVLIPEKKNNVTEAEMKNAGFQQPDFEENNINSQNNNCMKKNKGIFWGLLLVALGLLWLGRSFDLFHFSWCTVIRLWPLLIIWIGVTLLPIEQLWKNVCNFFLLSIAIVLLFVLPSTSCKHHFWKDKYQYEIKKKVKDADCEVDVDDDDFDFDDEKITVSVDSGVVTINRESKEDGETKVIVKKIKL